jgi:hypothetical protein
MKTAMQELIQWTIDVQYPIDIEFRDKVIELLEKEKEQIKTAFESGWNWNLSSEKYYQETYNQNK